MASLLRGGLANVCERSLLSPETTLLQLALNPCVSQTAACSSSTDLPAPPKSLELRRVVVTGVGIVCPVGVGVKDSWAAVLSGRSGVRGLTPEDLISDPEAAKGPVPQSILDAYDQIRTRVIARVDPVAHRSSPFYDRAADPRRTSPFMLMALTAAAESLSDAGWAPAADLDRERTGVFLGAGMSSPSDFLEASSLVAASRLRRLTPYFVPRVLPNMAAGAISMRHGLTGPSHAASTACATGAHAIGDAYRAIQRGDADVAVAGGTDACVDPISLGGFSSLRALSVKHNAAPSAASRPFDRARDGFVLAEGAAALILEELDHARARGARIYAEVRGYGLSSDAHHITQPAPGGAGALRAMRAALRGSGLDSSHVVHVNAHATSTPQGDEAEQAAIATLFGARATEPGHSDPVYVCSTKGATGHMLGAAGAAEAVFTVLALYDRSVPPTANLSDPEPLLVQHLVRGLPAALPGGRPLAALSNSFGFGGTNCSLLFATAP